MNEFKYLKKISNGRVFPYTEILEKNGGVVRCDVHGNIAIGHVGDAEAIDATQTRRKTKFLGNKNNGVLYRYTDILAELDNMISIDTKEQWESMQKTGEAPEKDTDALQPKLDKEPAPALGRQPKEPVVPASAKGLGTIALPVIEGMGAREAKTALSEWALKNFNQKIDRRPILEDVIATCQQLAVNAMDKTG